jgi:hypothetical protein
VRVDLLYWLAGRAYEFMNEMPGGWSFLWWGFVAAVPVVALHELGHAVVAVRRLGADVEVTVGNAVELARVRMGRIEASLNAVAHPGYAAGSASFDSSHATARDVLWIALAGPLASLVGWVTTASLLSLTASSGVLHDLLWSMTMAGAFAVVLSLLPLSPEESDGTKVWTDGRLALDAVGVLRG